MTMRLGIAPDYLVRGEPAVVSVTGGAPGAVTVIQLDDCAVSGAEQTSFEIQLDENGIGAEQRVMPAWGWIRVSAEGCDPMTRRVFPPPPFLGRLARRLALLVRMMDFVVSAAGRDHGCGRWKKLGMLRKILRCHRQMKPLSTLRQHLLMCEEILSIPPSVEGGVVECGCYGGGATVALSLACAATGRKLYVCDSFEGLPEPEERDRTAQRPDGSVVTWTAGDYASPGSQEGVERNVRALGAIEACVFVKGFFCDTLAALEAESIVLVFEDADLIASVEDCLRHLWPKMQPDTKFFCHEPWSFEIVLLFYDHAWWQREVGEPAPGFVGSGCGDTTAPGVGYARKVSSPAST